MRRKRPDEESDDDAPAEDATDCEAFLAGRYAEWLLQRRLRVPAWAWLNQAAHAPPVDVLFAATLPPATLRSPWEAARSAIAIDLMRSIADVSELEALRRELLVPLELDLARSTLEPALTSGQLVALVRNALQTHRRHV